MAEHHGVAAFQSDNLFALAGSTEQQAVDVVLLGVVATAALAYIDTLGGQRVEETLVYQIVVEDDVGLLKCFHGLDRQQVGVARAEANERDVPLTIIAPTKGGNGQIALQGVGLEGQHLADVGLHTQSFKRAGGHDGSIYLAVAHLTDALLDAAPDTHDLQVGTQGQEFLSAHG